MNKTVLFLVVSLAGFFLSKEFFLFNAELVFITSFLIFFFLALENVGTIISDSLDAREQEIKNEFFSLLTQKLTVLSKSYEVIYGLSFSAQHLKELLSFLDNYINFLVNYLRTAIKLQKRKNILNELLFTFKNLVLLAQELSEKAIKRVFIKTKIILLRLNNKLTRKRKTAKMKRFFKAHKQSKFIIKRLRKRVFFSRVKRKSFFRLKNKPKKIKLRLPSLLQKYKELFGTSKKKPLRSPTPPVKPIAVEKPKEIKKPLPQNSSKPQKTQTQPHTSKGPKEKKKGPKH